MKQEKNMCKDIKIAYIGGGSRGWSWGLMSDLARTENMSGTVYLYDIDRQAAADNEIIGNSVKGDNFNYISVDTIGEALEGADFVIISILPGTFDEMAVDVHTAEEFGIYQSVGDTTGIGGIMRALRTLPMFFGFGEEVKKHCPDAFVINYTNPMALCVAALYRAFPEIKCFGCCHEVFGTKNFLKEIVEQKFGYENLTRDDIKINVLGVNHFTWITQAYFRNIDLFPVYKEFCQENLKNGRINGGDNNWANKSFRSTDQVKMDLFLKYGYIAAAGDRHLAEFCPPHWYLKNPETVKEWGFELTTVDFRKNELVERIARKDRLLSGEEEFEIKETGEEGHLQMSALLGLNDFVTNVNIPNRGQIPNLPIGTIVETNARFCAGSITPVFAGEIPPTIKSLIDRAADMQRLILDAAWERSLDKAFLAFITEPQNNLDLKESRRLFDKMIEGTKEYLKDYH